MLITHQLSNWLRLNIRSVLRSYSSDSLRCRSWLRSERRIDCGRISASVFHRHEAQETHAHSPAGNSPLSSFDKCRPRNQPSPKSSSFSINSIFSPRFRLSSSGLRAVKSSVLSCQPSMLQRARKSQTAARPPSCRGTLTDNQKNISRGSLPQCRRVRHGKSDSSSALFGEKNARSNKPLIARFPLVEVAMTLAQPQQCYANTAAGSDAWRGRDKGFLLLAEGVDARSAVRLLQRQRSGRCRARANYRRIKP